VGQYLHVERTLKQDDASEEFSQKIEAITAGIVEMKTLDEQWDGATYYIKAEMAVDPKDLERRIAEVLNDKQKTKDLEEARKRTLAAEAENARLRKELEATKDEEQRLALQKTYTKAADVLSAEEYFTKGNNAYENGLYYIALEYYQKAIDINPNHADAYYNMGNAYHYLKNYAESIRCYQKAIDINPNYADAYYNMGIAYANLKNYNEALRHYQKAISIDPNYAAAYHNMGSAYIDLKNYAEAIRCYKKAIAINNPNHADAYYSMGNAYQYLKNYAEAIRCYKKAVELNPNYANAYINMGIAYAHLGNKKEHVKNYQQAARLGNSIAQEALREAGKKW
jgi:superkiller protein 3